MRKILFILFAGISLLIVDSCSDDGFPVPPASTVSKFTVSIDNDAFAPATATFTNISVIPERAGEVSYFWTFGDGTSSTQISPVHLYSTSGLYKVKLVLVTTESAEIVESSQDIVIKDSDASGTPFFFWAGGVRNTLINEDVPIVSAISTLATSSYGIVVDTLESKIYIGDDAAKKIYVCNFNGSDFHEFRTAVETITGLTIDYQTGKIYWGTEEGNIHRADLANATVTQIETVVTGQSNQPTGLAIDPVSRRLFWNNYDGGLWSKNIDASGGEALLVANPDGGGSVTIVGNRVLYDEYTSGDIKIKSVNLSGGDEKTIITGISRLMFSAIVYNPRDGKIYWSDRTASTIRRANLSGSGIEDYYVAEDGYPRAFALSKFE